jgi:adenylate kinase family enzyme
MRRVLILGCSGAGKSTFARCLAERTGLPLIHLDQLYWQPGWQEPTPQQWRITVERELARDAWIMDGHMGGTIPLRLRAADTAIFFDFPTRICVRRVAWRILRGYGSVRQDMADGCPERFDLAFLRFILGFRWTRRPGVLKALAAFEGELIVFRKPRDAKRFLAGLPVAELAAAQRMS